MSKKRETIKMKIIEDLWELLNDQLGGGFLQDHYFEEIVREFFEERGYKIEEEK